MKTVTEKETHDPLFRGVNVLLALLPFWAPLIPPMGIACLKSFLRQHGCEVKTADANTKKRFKDLYNHYFDTLIEAVPRNKRGNFYGIGYDVLRHHLMAHLNYKDENEYIQLVKEVIYKTFYIEVSVRHISKLNKFVALFYTQLESYVLDLLEYHSPTVLGLSVFSGTLPASLFAFRLTREKYPHIRTVMGGGIFYDQFAVGTPDFESLKEKTRDYIDKFVVGEGEILLLKLLRGELEESQRVYTSQDIEEESLDLSHVEIPDFDDFECFHYPYISAYTSRSCPHQCNFCSSTTMWGRYRRKKSSQVVEELTRLYRQYGSQLFLMCDLLLNPVITDLAKEFVKSGISIYWDGCLRVDEKACNHELALLWRQGGFYRARIGCESGSQKVLQLMNKRITPAQIKMSVSNLAQTGTQTSTYWIIGYPGETEKDFQQTLDLITELQDDVYEAECRPFHYYLKGQANSGEWTKIEKSLPLYPGKALDMLLFQTWLPDSEPSREETYQRVNRFVEHCRNLGIPSTYTLKDIYEADGRWKKLHPKAVPSLVAFKNKEIYIDECKHIEALLFIPETPQEQGDFVF